MSNRLLGIVGTIVALGSAGAWVFSEYTVHQYNDYAETIRPLLAEQDALLKEIDQTADKEGPAKVDAWIAQSKDLRSRFEAVTPEDAEIAAFHKYWLLRADSITQALEVAKIYFKTKKQSDMALLTQHFATAKKHLDAFLAARDVYAKKHNLKIE